MAYCENCGNKVSENGKFCFKCGTKIHLSNENQEQISAKSDAPTKFSKRDIQNGEEEKKKMKYPSL